MFINIEKYPQYQLYLLTKKLNLYKNKLIPDGCDSRCIKSTIINRAYYSAYLYAEEWLWETYRFKPKHKYEFDDENFITEHQQIQDELKHNNKITSNFKLSYLHKLRKKADYHPFEDLSDEEVNISLNYMEFIFNDLKFN